MVRAVCAFQGLFYLLTGLWPFLSMESFLAVTGPKTDLWLVQTVAALILVIGAVLIYAAARREITGSVALLALGSATMFTLIDSFYALRGVIWGIYLLDAIAEVLIIALWIAALLRERTSMRGSRSSRPYSTGPSPSARSSV